MLSGQVRESRLVDMVGQLERARASGVSPTERAQCLDSITAEAGRVRSGRDADAAAAILDKVLLLLCPCDTSVLLDHTVCVSCYG